MPKPNLILLHGWNQKPDYFDPIKSKLENKYKIFSPIMPGFGDIRITSPYNLDDYANWLKNYISTNKISDPILLGHSFGGSVCIRFLSKYPNQKTKLILVNAAIVKDKYSLRKKIYYFLIYVLKPKITFRKAKYQNLNSSTMKTTFQRVVYSDLIKEARKLNNQTLIIWGNLDLITPLSFGQKIHQHMNNSTIKVIKNSGHFPFIDNPKKFIFHLKSFLA